jgi:hypothetical protein
MKISAEFRKLLVENTLKDAQTTARLRHKLAIIFLKICKFGYKRTAYRIYSSTTFNRSLVGYFLWMFPNFNSEYFEVQYCMGARGNVVVKALYYKPEGRGFDSRLGKFLNLPNLSGRTRPWGLLSL